MVHGRFTLPGRPALIAVDILRLQDIVLAEHWDALEEEVGRAASAGGSPMFSDNSPE